MIVFFDVDGVLIDGWHSSSALRKPWDETLEADLGVDRAAFQRLFFQGPDGDHRGSPMFDCTVGRRDLMEALAGILPRVGYAGNAEDFARYWFEKDSNINRQVIGLVETIRRSGARLYVATGQEHHRARYLWNELGFSRWFDRLFYSAGIVIRKATCASSRQSTATSVSTARRHRCSSTISRRSSRSHAPWAGRPRHSMQPTTSKTTRGFDTSGTEQPGPFRRANYGEIIVAARELPSGKTAKPRLP